MNIISPPIILALDVPTPEDALTWVNKLKDQIRVFKIGMQLFYQAGPDMVRRIHDTGAEVFLDLKLHDIPHTVARACESLLPLEPYLLNVHASGGLAMMEAAKDVISGSKTNLIAVTALTSQNETAERVLYLAGLAKQAGLSGVVCSGHENADIRQSLGLDFCLVNPGIRLAGGTSHDQVRIMTPQQAISAGANFVVMGRPILEAADPVGLIAQIKEDIYHE